MTGPASGVNCALIYPPLTDPTCGYHSLAYLAAAVRAAGAHGVSVIDANVEAVVSCARPAHVRSLQAGLERRLDALPRTGAWTRDLFRAYRDIVFGADLTSEAVADAMTVLRDPARFFDYGEYRKAALVLERWLQLLATSGAPGMFRHFAVTNVNLQHSSFFTDPARLDRLGAPFRSYFCDELIPRLAAARVDVAGIGVTYRSQLPFALYLARLISKRLPDVRCVLGGTDVSQLWKFARDSRAFAELFQFADAIVVGEGEQALVAILDAYAAGRQPEGPGILTRRQPRGGPAWHPRYEDVETLPTPSFGDLPWDQYLSPDRLALYSPTRGCYWDRCTFCDYGLATDRPTSPWRQRSIPRVIEDLQAISRDSRFIYFSVDVIAPAYLMKLARAIVDHGIDIRWGAELRLEKYFDDSHCALLRESGCVAVSVGFESGSQRVLDLIDKGTKITEVKRVVGALSRAGIGVQIMGFTGFPSESFAEALESVAVLKDLREHWIFGGLDTFQLTAGSIVARRPDAFGLASVGPRPGEDLGQYLAFSESRPSKRPEEVAEVAQRRRRLRHPLQLSRPFLGGIDAAHTLFYLARYGRALRPHLDRALGVETDEARLQLEGRILDHIPAGAAPFVADSHASTAPVDIAVLATTDGRLHECPRFVARVAGLLDGQWTRLQVLDLAARTLAMAPETTLFSLRFLADRQGLRYLSS